MLKSNKLQHTNTFLQLLLKCLNVILAINFLDISTAMRESNIN